MRKCSTCKEEKPLTDFYAKGKDSVQANCKTCHNKYCIERWKKRKLEAIEYKGGKCNRCGYNSYYGALEFHHINPNEKEMNWTKMRLVAWDRIIEELDKCQLLCANCHREIHHEGK